MLDANAHERTIIRRQLFVGHVVGLEPMKRKEKMNRMMRVILLGEPTISFQYFLLDSNIIKQKV